LPILQILGLAYAVGGLPIGLKLGIINNEVTNSSMCNYYVKKSLSVLNADENCSVDYASCHFLNEIQENDIEKVYYNTFQEALMDAKRGRVSGIISIHHNVSELLTKMLMTGDFESYIEINLDQSSLQLTTFLQTRLFRAYERFNERLLRNCKMNEKLWSIPVDFSETFYGAIESDFKATLFPSVILQLSTYL
jgi:hypothetical protein